MNKLPDTILITGAGGVLGRELVEQLIKKEKCHIITLEITKENFPLDFFHNDRIECYDNRDWKDGRLPWDKIDVVVHSAFARSSNGRLLAASLEFTKELFTQAVENNVSSIINISSQSVYGRSQPPLWTEKTPVSPEPPDTLYALAKYASELLALSICNTRNSKTAVTNLRLASLSGRGMDERLTSRFVKSALEGKPIKLIGGKQTMAYMDVRDAADGIIALMSTDTSKWKNVYNFGNQFRHSIKEIAETVARISKKYTTNPVKIEIEYKDVHLDTGMDSTLFYTDANWTPKHDLESMIDWIFSHYTKKDED